MNINTSPLSDDQIELFTRLTNSLSKEQLAWVSGYLAGFSASGVSSESPEIQEPVAETNIQNTLTILYGSRTGNGEGLAKKALKMATEQGLNATIKSMADYKVRDLQSEKNLLVIVSTHGEGVPPFAARELHEFIYSKRAPKLENTTFAVLALGDSSYFQFCKTGKDFDEQLEKLGAKRLVPRIACDVDFEEAAENWLKATLPAFGDGKATAKAKPQFRLDIPVKVSVAEKKPEAHTKKNPFMAPVYEKISLHGKGSKRQTLHIELSTENAPGLDYEPGDAAGVYPLNSAELVGDVLAVTGLNAGDFVIFNGVEKKLETALHRNVELSKITTDVVGRYLETYPNKKLKKLSEDTDKFKEYLDGRDIVDLLQDYPSEITAENLIKILRPLQPRYYSIASSPKAYPGELHLTVGVVNYENAGREKYGTCSTYLSEVEVEDEKVPIFIERNPGFRLPENDETPIIMVGAGTGIAPYRAFVQHRELAEKPGKSWLFFGNRNFETEFLYQTEWQGFLKSGALTKMDVAFSRDGDKKVYVQDRLLENAKEVYQWLEEGSNFYICGDMKNMARHVQDTLVKIVEKEGVMTKENAQEYVANLEKERRLQLDVY
ncbi:sulfite reductase (NADPH) flavoprotein, alpha chain [Paludibacter propionicigenes WB4]|uniref:assimilatory sulfite reductase (NADPH) n=2 Tax=Paludibacter TaxID=346096 RepID=E4T7I7_PALPW|nr:sulfite reductase (NADPH) flavoprotein, alpha chain [Paludibacter propionicigenes WB4]